MNNKSNRLAFLLIIVIIFTVMLAGCNSSLSSLLTDGDYQKAYEIYESNISDNKNILTEFLDNSIQSYNQGDIDYEEITKVIDELKSAGFDETQLSEAISILDTLNISKTAFEDATTQLENAEYDVALDNLQKVIESDTNYTGSQNLIDEINSLLENTNISYDSIDEYLENNDYDNALTVCNEIIEAGIIPNKADEISQMIQSINSSWEDAVSKNTYYNSIATDNECIYFPHHIDNNHLIIKYDLTSKETSILPIAKCISSYVIKDINIIGEYLYFIAGENVGSGRQVDSPYNIYRMNTDGSHLTLVKKGNFTNLLAFSNGFYASIYGKGLVQFDRYLKEVKTITDEEIIFMQLFSDTLYYTAIEDNTHRSINKIYTYNGDVSKVNENVYLNSYQYDEMMLNIYKRRGIVETMEYQHISKTEETPIPSRDVMELIGYLDGEIYYSQDGELGQPLYRSYNIFENKETEYFSSLSLPHEYIIDGILFNSSQFLMNSNNNYYLADTNLNIQEEINLDDIDYSSLVYSDSVLLHDDNTWFSDEEIIICDDDFWYYSSDNYNVTVERKYLSDCDTYVFISHIRTKEQLGIGVESITDEAVALKQKAFADILAKEHQPILCSNGDFFFESHNPWTGIVIRNGIVYKDELQRDMIAFYPDGRLICYDKNDDITADKLLSDGVNDTMSFGPILMRDGEIFEPCYTAPLSEENPRNGIGMVEPGHYVNILADGRQFDISLGLTYYTYAKVFQLEGCKEAYNLDGGQSTALLFMGKYLNSHENDHGHSKFRPVAEIVTFGHSDSVPYDGLDNASPIR